MNSAKESSFSNQIQNAIAWLLPVGLIISTFLILFFMISEQVGNLKTSHSQLQSDNIILKKKLESVESKLSDKKDIPSGNNSEISFVNKDSGVAKVNLKVVTPDAANKKYAMYSFTSDYLINEPVKFTVLGNSGVQVVHYETKKDAGKVEWPVIDILEFNDSNSSVNFSLDKNITVYQVNTASQSKVNPNKLVIFVDDQFVMYHDFNEKTEDVKTVLKLISESNDKIPEKTKNAAKQQVSKLK